MDHEELQVTVHNEDDGDVATIPGRPEQWVREIVEAMYAAFNLEKQPGDRLRCEAGGDDVFAHMDETLEAYRAIHCHTLVWLFAAEQGGA